MKLKSNTKICTHCGHIGTPAPQEKASFLIDVFAWVVFVSLAMLTTHISLLSIPLVWTIYHVSQYNKVVCPLCKNLTMVEIESRKGQTAAQFHARPISPF